MKIKSWLFAASISLFLCGQVFAGNIIEQIAGDKVSLSNIIYEDRTDALLLKTGQTISYHANDDGDLELGIAHSYTVLTTGQCAGSTNVTINGKTHVTSNACVQDNNTGKMFLREVIQSDLGPANNGKLFWDQYTLSAETCTCNATNKTITADAGTPFSTAALCAGRIFTIASSALGNNGTFTVTNITTSVITVSESVTDEASIALDFASVDDLIWDLVDQANANSLAGYSDWRIPNRGELASIVDLKYYGPAINSTIFSSTPSLYHWASSMDLCNNDWVWFVDFSRGYVYILNKHTSLYPVRLVRN